MAPDYTSNTFPTIVTSCNNTGCANGGGGYRSSAIMNTATIDTDISDAIKRCKQLIDDAKRNGNSMVSLQRDLRALESATRLATKYGSKRKKK